MKEKIKIEGLECANCARKLEEAICKLDDVQSASFNFSTSTLKFESENPQNAIKSIITLTKKMEPDAVITAEKSSTQKNKFGKHLEIATLIFGVLLMVVLFVTNLPNWAYWLLYVLSALLLGWKTYIKALRLLFKGTINENLLITISVIGASVPGISEHLEGLMVAALYSFGKILESMAVDKSRKSIASLIQTQPEFVTLMDDGNEKKVHPEDVEVGSLILVRSGEKIALDGTVEKGCCSLDTQSLTGESLPRVVKEGDSVLSGAIVLDSPIQIRTTTSCKESTLTKIMNLVENASENKSKTETFISKISKWYTLGVVVLAVLVWLIVWVVTKNIEDAFYRGLTFLVISCPCAFAISVPLSYFSGLGNASRHGILIKGSNHLDTCAKIKTLAFDKTGTLTTGEFSVNKVVSLDENFSQEDIVWLCAIGEQNSIHPLAKAILTANKKELKNAENLKEIAGKGIEFSFESRTYFIGRGDESVCEDQTEIDVFENGKRVGYVLLSDVIKPTAQATCSVLEKMGIKTVMLSGDNTKSAEKIASEAGISEVHANLLPQDKFAWLEKEKAQTCVGFVGDGLNDAPAMLQANVGISMGISGSDASIEASDIVLVDDNPEKIISAIKISKKTRKIVWENIILSAIVKVTFLCLGAFGITGMMWAVFADVGVTVLAILNSLRALK